MVVNQLSVFIENKAGRLEQVLEALKAENINIISLSLADSSDYGLLRMIVSEPEKAKDYAQLLTYQAQLMAELPIEDPFAYTKLVCKLMK